MRSAAIFAAVLSLWATPAVPEQPTIYPKTDVYDGMPPPQMRGPATMTVATGTLDDCGEPGPGLVFEACVRSGIVHMPNPCDFSDEEFARLLCHEQAHAAHHWPADHGG
jgi:hypothetical protein